MTLRNAIEVSPSPPGIMLTVQLGQDFLLSGLLSVIDVEVGDEQEQGEGSFFRVIGEESWSVAEVSRENPFDFLHTMARWQTFP